MNYNYFNNTCSSIKPFLERFKRFIDRLKLGEMKEWKDVKWNLMFNANIKILLHLYYQSCQLGCWSKHKLDKSFNHWQGKIRNFLTTDKTITLWQGKIRNFLGCNTRKWNTCTCIWDLRSLVIRNSTWTSYPLLKHSCLIVSLRNQHHVILFVR